MPFLRTRVSKGFRVSDLRGVGRGLGFGGSGFGSHDEGAESHGVS